jgi:hypothetical protein
MSVGAFMVGVLSGVGIYLNLCLCVLVGGPVARGGGEGGNCGRGVRAEEKTQRGGDPTGDTWSKAGQREKARAAGIGLRQAGADARD